MKLKGFFLISILLILVILASLSLTFVTFAQRQLYFAKIQERNIVCFYLAKAGIEYYIKKFPLSVQALPQKIYLTENKKYLFELDIKENNLYSKGIIQNSSRKIISQKILVAPLNNLANFYEVP